MMYFLLILFFSSLFGITFMIGKKLIILQNIQALHNEEINFKTSHLEEWKDLSIKGLKKHSYNGLVSIIRAYIHSVNFLKKTYRNIKDALIEKVNSNSSQKKEISKFLKVVSDYKYKIRKIKDRVKEEENL